MVSQLGDNKNKNRFGEQVNDQLAKGHEGIMGQIQNGFDVGQNLGLGPQAGDRQGPSGFLSGLINQEPQSVMAPVQGLLPPLPSDGSDPQVGFVPEVEEQSIPEPRYTPTAQPPGTERDFSNSVGLGDSSFISPQQAAIPQAAPQTQLPQQAVGFNNGTPPQEEGQAKEFNPFSGFFTGDGNNPNGLLRLAEGYNNGGLVGALGLLGTDLSQKGNGNIGVDDRIKRQQQLKGY